MPILLTCPSCNKTLKAPDSVAGRKVKCPQCATVLDVPAPAAEPPTAVSAAPPPPLVEPAPAPPHYQADDRAPPPRGWDRRRRETAPAGGEGGLQLGLGIASLATGAVGLLLALVPCIGYIIGMPVAGIGLLLGLVGLIVALNQKGRGIAFPIAGSATSVLGLGVGLYWMLVVARVTRTIEDIGAGVKQAVEQLPKLKVQPPEDVAQARQKQESKNNLRQIGLAFHAFHKTYNHYPEATGNGANGKGGLSWRVALLPELGEADLHSQFKRDEPWNSPHNMKLLDRMPKVYASPCGNAPAGHTFYQVFTGPNTPFPPGQRFRFINFTDGTANTFLVVEGGNAVPWTKPEDMPFDRKGPLPALGGMFPDGFHAVMGSGEVRFIRRPLYGDDLLRNLIDPMDGIPINRPD